MKDSSFDYIYQLVTSNEDDFEWWENKGYFKFANYLNNLNEVAFTRLMKDSEKWHTDFQFIFAESLLKSKVETAFEKYVEIFVEMENMNHALYMSSILENIENTDTSKSLFIKFKAKMSSVMEFEKKQNENSKVIKLKI